MLNQQILPKGKKNIEILTNNISENNITIYKIFENSNNILTVSDITENNNIENISNKLFKKYTFNAPNEDCYLFIRFNNQNIFFRVGNPIIKIFFYTGIDKEYINYSIMNKNGEQLENGKMINIVGLGLYYIKPNNIGDLILNIENYKPFMIHTPYYINKENKNGKIIFQKDTWSMQAIPVINKKIADVVKEIENKYNVKGEDIFQLFTAQPSNDNQSNITLDFIPGTTPLDSKNNFNLMYLDNDAIEITGFQCKTKNYLIDNDPNKLIVYEWSEE